MKTSKKAAICKPEKGFLSDTKLAGTLTMDFSASRMVGSKYCWLSPQSMIFFMVAQTDWDSVHGTEDFNRIQDARRMENMNLSWILRKLAFPEKKISEEHLNSTVLSSNSLGLLFRLYCWGYSFLNGKNGNSPSSKLALVSFVLYSLYRKPLLVVTWPWPKPTAWPGEVTSGPGIQEGFSWVRKGAEGQVSRLLELRVLDQISNGRNQTVKQGRAGW